MTKSSNSGTSTLTRNPHGSRSPTRELAMLRPQLRDLIGEDAAELTGWLRARQPAHGLSILQEALGDDGYTPPVVDATVSEPQPEPEPLSDKAISERDAADDVPETALPLGADLHTGATVSVDLAALRKHVAIFAGTGSGKTVLIRRLVEECARCAGCW